MPKAKQPKLIKAKKKSLDKDIEKGMSSDDDLKDFKLTPTQKMKRKMASQKSSTSKMTSVEATPKRPRPADLQLADAYAGDEEGKSFGNKRKRPLPSSEGKRTKASPALKPKTVPFSNNRQDDSDSDYDKTPKTRAIKMPKAKKKSLGKDIEKRMSSDDDLKHFKLTPTQKMKRKIASQKASTSKTMSEETTPKRPKPTDLLTTTASKLSMKRQVANADAVDGDTNHRDETVKSFGHKRKRPLPSSEGRTTKASPAHKPNVVPSNHRYEDSDSDYGEAPKMAKCTACGRKFSNNGGLKIHQTLAFSDCNPNFVVAKNKVLIPRTSFQQYLQNNVERPTHPYICPRAPCPYKTTWRKDFKKHALAINSLCFVKFFANFGNSFVCDRCNTNYKTSQDLKAHFQDKESDCIKNFMIIKSATAKMDLWKSYKCPRCDKIFSTDAKFDKHCNGGNSLCFQKAISTAMAEFRATINERECQYCHKSFLNDKSCAGHEKTCSTITNVSAQPAPKLFPHVITCPNCKLEFETRPLFYKHIYTHQSLCYKNRSNPAMISIFKSSRKLTRQCRRCRVRFSNEPKYYHHKMSCVRPPKVEKQVKTMKKKQITPLRTTPLLPDLCLNQHQQFRDPKTVKKEKKKQRRTLPTIKAPSEVIVSRNEKQLKRQLLRVSQANPSSAATYSAMKARATLLKILKENDMSGFLDRAFYKKFVYEDRPQEIVSREKCLQTSIPSFLWMIEQRTLLFKNFKNPYLAYAFCNHPKCFNVGKVPERKRQGWKCEQHSTVCQWATVIVRDALNTDSHVTLAINCVRQQSEQEFPSDAMIRKAIKIMKVHPHSKVTKYIKSRKSGVQWTIISSVPKWVSYDDRTDNYSALSLAHWIKLASTDKPDKPNIFLTTMIQVTSLKKFAPKLKEYLESMDCSDFYSAAVSTATIKKESRKFEKIIFTSMNDIHNDKSFTSQFCFTLDCCKESKTLPCIIYIIQTITNMLYVGINEHPKATQIASLCHERVRRDATKFGQYMKQEYQSDFIKSERVMLYCDHTEKSDMEGYGQISIFLGCLLGSKFDKARCQILNRLIYLPRIIPQKSMAMLNQLHLVNFQEQLCIRFAI